MPDNTGMTAVLVNPADDLTSELTPEQLEDIKRLEELRQKLLSQGVKTPFTTGRSGATRDATPPPDWKPQVKQSWQEVEPMLREAWERREGSVIAIFPQLTDNSRVVAACPEHETSGRKAWRFCTWYPITAETGKVRYEGAKFMLAGPREVTDLGVAAGELIAMSYVTYPRQGQAPSATEPSLKAEV